MLDNLREISKKVLNREIRPRGAAMADASAHAAPHGHYHVPD